MEVIVAKHFEFEASHQLPNEECYGKCINLHGHTYKLTVAVAGEINEKGWVVDFKVLKEIVNKNVISVYDHQHLNEFFLIPTAENVAAVIQTKIKEALQRDYPNIRLHSITLYETSNSFVKIEG